MQIYKVFCDLFIKCHYADQLSIWLLHGSIILLMPDTMLVQANVSHTVVRTFLRCMSLM